MTTDTAGQPASSHLPTLGLRLPNSGPFATPKAILAGADLADRLGFNTAWVHDHISWPTHELTHFATGSVEACGDQDPNFFESLTTLGVIGGRVSRARLGVAGLVLPLRDPRVLAKQVATVDQLTNGRLTLAFGVGAKPHDFEVMGVRWDRRGRITDDYLAALRAILGLEQPVSFESDGVSFHDGSFYPKPVGLRIWIAGKRPSFPRVVRHADGWLVGLVTPQRFKALKDELAQMAEVEGRDPATIDAAAEVFACIGRTHEDALAISSASLNYRKWSEEDPTTVNIIGTSSEACERLAEYAAAGAKHVELRMICHSMEQFADMAEDIATAAGLVVGM